MERRRRWAASGRLPPGLAAPFTLAEQAVLSLVAPRPLGERTCRLSIEEPSAVAGVCRSTVKKRHPRGAPARAAHRRRAGDHRLQKRHQHRPHRLGRVAAWLRLARRRDRNFRLGRDKAQPLLRQGGGVKSVTSTPTKVLTLSESGKTDPSEAAGGQRGDLNQATSSRIRAGRWTAKPCADRLAPPV